MDTPGSLLKTERENQRKSLKEVAKKLKINPEYLHAIEDNNYELLPADVFTKAYIRLYAEEMGLDPAYVLDLFISIRKESDDKGIESSKKKLSLAPFKKLRLPRLPWKPVLIISAAAVLVLAALLFIKPDKEKPDLQPVPKAEKKEQKIKDESAIEEPDLQPAPQTKGNEQKIKDENVVEEKKVEEIHLEIIADEITWVSVSIDGGSPDELLLRAGESKTVTATESFALKIGNAGGTRLVFEGKDMGTLGPHGKVVDIFLP